MFCPKKNSKNYSTTGKIWVAASIIPYKNFCLFKSKNLKNIHKKIYETFTLPRLDLNKLFVDLLHQQRIKS